MGVRRNYEVSQLQREIYDLKMILEEALNQLVFYRISSSESYPSGTALNLEERIVEAMQL